MENLKCTAKKCIHNDNCQCGANTIQVRGGMTKEARNTFCNSYTDNAGDYIFTSMENSDGKLSGTANIGDGLFSSRWGDTEFGSDMHNEETRVICTASKCRHNQNYNCAAKSIEIKGPGESQTGRTACASFNLI